MAGQRGIGDIHDPCPRPQTSCFEPLRRYAGDKGNTGTEVIPAPHGTAEDLIDAWKGCMIRSAPKVSCLMEEVPSSRRKRGEARIMAHKGSARCSRMRPAERSYRCDAKQAIDVLSAQGQDKHCVRAKDSSLNNWLKLGVPKGVASRP